MRYIARVNDAVATVGVERGLVLKIRPHTTTRVGTSALLTPDLSRNLANPLNTWRECGAAWAPGCSEHSTVERAAIKWTLPMMHAAENDQQRGDFLISTDKAKLDLGMIHDYLSRQSYWAQGRPFEIVRDSVENSLCFGMYQGDQQVGFARVVTDYATFAWLCDVFILESHRGEGLGKWLIECVAGHALLGELKLFILATRDAHELYRRYGGFGGLQTSEKWMVRSPRTTTSVGDDQ